MYIVLCIKSVLLHMWVHMSLNVLFHDFLYFYLFFSLHLNCGKKVPCYLVHLHSPTGIFTLQEELLCILCTLMNFFPQSIHRHYDNVVALLLSGKESPPPLGGLLVSDQTSILSMRSLSNCWELKFVL